MRNTASQASDLHQDGIMYGITTSMPKSFLQGMSVRAISQPRTLPRGTLTSTVKKPQTSEFFSGPHSVALAI